MNYLKRIKGSVNPKNFKKGIDEQYLYGPITSIFLIVYLFLFIYSKLSLVTFAISLIVLAYIFFIYFPFHKNKKITLGTMFLFGGISYLFGWYLLFTKNIAFGNIRAVSIIFVTMILIAFLLIYFSSKRRNLEESDQTLSFFRDKVGAWILPVIVVLSLSGFSIMAPTYLFLGQEHVFIWVPIILLFFISGFRLFYYKIIKKSKYHSR